MNQEVDFRTAVSLCNNNKNVYLWLLWMMIRMNWFCLYVISSKEVWFTSVSKTEIGHLGEHVTRITPGEEPLCSCFPAPFCCRYTFYLMLIHGASAMGRMMLKKLPVEHCLCSTVGHILWGVSTKDETVEPLVPKVGEKRCQLKKKKMKLFFLLWCFSLSSLCVCVFFPFNAILNKGKLK